MTKSKLYLNSMVVIILFSMFFSGVQSGFAQVQVNFVNLTRGKLWQSVFNDGRVGVGWFPWKDESDWSPLLHLMEWPAGPTDTRETRYANSKGSGVLLSAINVTNVSGEVRPTMGVECGNVRAPNLSDVYPVADPQLIKNYGLTDANIPAEEMAVAIWATKMGITIQRRSMAWGNGNQHGDYILHELTLTNTGDMTGDGNTNVEQTIQELYIGIIHGFCISQIGNTFQKTEWGKGNRDDEGVYDTEAKVFYAFDGDNTKTAQDDTGDPDPDTGLLYSATYAGFKLLDSPDFENQPVVYNWWNKHNNTFELAKQGEQDFRKGLYLKTTGEYPPTMYGEPLCIMGIGPYNIEYGGSVKIVYAEACGGINMAERVAGNLELMATGKDSLYNAFAAAEFNYKHGYNIPDAPKVPLTITTEATTNGTIKSTWDTDAESTVDPDYSGTEENDFDGYRLYRSEVSQMGPWTLAKEWRISKGDQIVNEYEDGDIQLGNGYFYAISSIDKGHSDWPFYQAGDAGGAIPPLESRKVASDKPMYKIRRLGKTLDEIKVVPNPFKVRSGLPTVGDDLRILFINLPAVCTIRIYTVYGDLVQTIEHTNGTGGESWGLDSFEYQVSQYTQRVAPGIYVYYIEAEEGEHIGKFVIIK